MWDQIKSKIEKAASAQGVRSPWPRSFMHKLAGATMLLPSKEDKDIFMASVSTIIDVDDPKDLSNPDVQQDVLFKAGQLGNLFKKDREKKQ